jgi:hypothetical protein
MELIAAFPNDEPLVRLLRNGPLFVIEMDSKDNRFTLAFMAALNGCLDKISAIRKAEKGPAALITTSNLYFNAFSHLI